MQTDHHQQHLYQVPNCTICLNELTQDLANLTCGHVFHITCITQHFQYRGTCPNCQKRSHQKQIRYVVYPLQRNNQSQKLMRQVLGNLSIEEKQQVQVLFKQLQIATQKTQKLQNTVSQTQKQLKKASHQLNDTKRAYNQTKIDYQTLKRDSSQLKKVIDHLHNQIKKLNDQEFNLRLQIDEYKSIQQELTNLKKLKKILQQQAVSLIKYKNELESKNTPPEQMAKLFFDMVMIKNLQTMKLKQKLLGLPQKISQQTQQIKRLKQLVQRQKKQTKNLTSKRLQDRKKHDLLKQKYKNLFDKYKAKCQSISDEQNYQDSMLSRPSFPIVNTTINNNNRSNNSNNLIIPNIFVLQKSTSNDQNSSSNVPLETKLTNKNSLNMFDTIIQQEPSLERNSNAQRKPVQSSLNSFFTQKPITQNNFGTFGGGLNKKKAEDNKKPAAMKNLFS